MAEVAMAAAMGAASAVVDMALGVEASEVFPSCSHRLLRHSTRRPRRLSTCPPHSRPGAEVEAREEVSRGPATGATELFVFRNKDNDRGGTKMDQNRKMF